MFFWQHVSKKLKFILLPVLGAVLFGTMYASAQFAPELPPVEVTLNVGDTILTVEGQTAPGAFVTILENSSPIGTTTANGSGDFSRSFTAQTPGLHTISVYASVEGVTTDTVTRTVNLVAQAETTVNFFLPSTLVLDADSVVQGDSITFSGATIPNGSITINIDNNLTLTASANSSGKWSHTLSTEGFSLGTHHVFVVVNDGFGNQSAPTTKRAFQVVSPEAPEAPPPVVVPPGFIAAPTITSPTNNQRFSDSPIEVRGIALAHSQVEIWDGDELVGSVFANHLGEWHFMMNLSEPEHNIRARACVLDVCSDFSESVRIFYDGADQPDPFFLRLDNYRYSNVPVEQPIQLQLLYGGGKAPYELVVDWGDEAVEQLTVDRAGGMALDHAYENMGQFTGVVTMRDSENALQMAYFSVLVVEGPKSWLTPVVVITILAGTVGAGGLFVASRVMWLRHIKPKWFLRKPPSPPTD